MFAAIVDESLSSSSSSFFILLVVSEITIVLDNMFYVNHFRDINKCSDAASPLLLCVMYFFSTPTAGHFSWITLDLRLQWALEAVSPAA